MYDTVGIAQIAEEVTRKTGIRAYPGSIARVLGAVQRSSNFWTIISVANEPVPLVAEAVRSLGAAALLKITPDGVFLTPDGFSFCKYAGIFPPVDNACPACAGTGVSLARYQETLDAFREITQTRPCPVAAFDQGLITPESTLRRIALMDRHGDLKGKELLVLGDDDLVGLAAALTGLPARVVVLEIDPRLVEFMARAWETYRLQLEVEPRDLRDALPAHLVGRFDVVETDPPESEGGFRLFVRRALSGLKGPRNAAYFGLTRAESSLDKWAALQKFFLENYAAITEILPDFHEYELWEYHAETRAAKLAPAPQEPEARWYRSAIVRVETLHGFAPHDVPQDEAEEGIYKDEESSTT